MIISEVFTSIQGEGIKIGILTTFIRLFGCNLECSWCDTKYSKKGVGKSKSILEIVKFIEGVDNVCITGGEPLLQDEVYDLINIILNKGKTIVLETNGSISLKRLVENDKLIISMDWKCPSSKMNEFMIFENLKYLKKTDQLKFIIGNEEDLRYMEDILKKEKIVCEIIVTPVGGVEIKSIAKEIIDKKINVRVLPQLHKIIFGDKRGV